MRLTKLQALVASASAAGSFQQQIEAFVGQARLLAADGLTWSEVGHLFVAFIVMLVNAAEALIDPSGQAASGEDKKQAVLAAVGYLFDMIAPALPLPMFLSPFRSWLTSSLRALVMSLADGAIEAAVSRLPATPVNPAAAAARVA
jgi:hypothetical protein